MKQLQKALEERKLNAAAGVLVLWVALGPWVWGYAGSPAAVASHVFFIFAFGPLTLLILVFRPAAYAVLAAGLWLAVEPLAARLRNPPLSLAERTGHRSTAQRRRRARGRDQRHGVCPHPPPAPPARDEFHRRRHGWLTLVAARVRSR